MNTLAGGHWQQPQSRHGTQSDWVANGFTTGGTYLETCLSLDQPTKHYEK
jgi:hypothetical protein